MLNRLLRRRRAKSDKTHTKKRLANPESLETRALLAADAVGDPLLVSDLFSATQLNPLSQVSSIDAMVSGEQAATVVFHGHGVTSNRLPGDDREIFFQQFSGDTASGSVSAANQITRGDQFHARADTAEDGSFWVVWSGRGEGDRHGVFARRFDVNGIALTDQVRVNTTRGGNQSHADIGTADDGSAVVVWHGVGTGDFDGVFAQRLAFDGTLVGGETLVNQQTDDQQAFPVLAVDSDGLFVAAWSSRHQDGDDWGVFARRFDTDGGALDDEFQVAVQTPGSQHLPAIDMSDDGDFVVSWNSSGQDSDGLGVFARQFTADGNPSGETQISNDVAGNQRNSSVAVSYAGEFLISWLQEGSGGWEVVGQTFDSDGAEDGDQFTVNTDVSGLDAIRNQTPSAAINGFSNSLIAFEGITSSRQSGIFAQRYSVDVERPANQKPNITQIDDFNARVGDTVELLLEASDSNRGDTLSFSFEVNSSANELKGAELVDNGDNTATLTWTPTEEDRNATVFFRVIVVDDGDPPMSEVTQFGISIDNSVPVVNLNNSGQIRLADGVESILLTTDDFEIVDEDQNDLVSATITIRGSLDTDERISIDTAGTDIVATFQNGTMALTGAASIDDYEQVFKTLTYVNDDEGRTPGIRNVDIVVADGTAVSRLVSIAVNVLGQNNAPTIADIGTQEVLIGSPLNLGIDGFDADGDDLTYTIASSDPSLVTAEVRTGNRSWQLDVEGPAFGIDGAMIFEFFETEAPLATGRFIELTQDDFYDGIIFHRVIDGFVIQGGDPTGTGSGGSGLANFDDQFDVDLQHNRTGVLSMAQTSRDDTNDSQFFVTEGATRNLDANHTVFGVLTEGESIREAISNVSVDGFDRPIDDSDPLNPVTADVTIVNAQIINDMQNAAVILRGVEGATGTAEITVTVSDGTETTSQTFTVTVADDTVNTRPWLNEVPVVQTDVDTPTTVQLTGTDVEGDTIRFFGPSEASAETTISEFDVLLPPDDVEVTVDSVTGLLTVTPSNGFTGTFEVTVGVSEVNPVDSDTDSLPFVNDFQDIEIQVG